ncbi:MAG: glycosyltransferase [Prevotella sp.]|nr:glycosyltransferase [Prevotella sp.]
MMTSETQKRQVVVSMTTFPAAVPYAQQAILSILKGSVLPDKLVLYLFFRQFPDGCPPEDLTALSRKNPIFEIRDYPRDIRSYLKLIPALRDFPEAVIVTVDDDIVYHKHLLRDLLTLHAQVPDAVLAHRARRIQPDKPYRKWRKYHWYNFFLHRIYRRYDTLPTGVGGVLYPPHCLKKEMLDEDLFTAIAPTTDDIWFWAAATANNVPVVPVPFGQNKPHELDKPKELSLQTVNYKGATDKNIAALRAILEHFPDVKERMKNQDE